MLEDVRIEMNMQDKKIRKASRWTVFVREMHRQGQVPVQYSGPGMNTKYSFHELNLSFC